MKPGPNNVGNSLEDELLQLVARQASRVPFPVFLGAAIIAGFASSYVPTFIWGSWFGLAISMLLIRWFIYRKLPTLTQLSTKQRIRIIILLNGVHGVTYGISLGFFPYFSELERAIQTILLMGMCVGAVSTTAGYRSIFYVFLFPVILPMSLMWSVSPGHSDNHVPEYLASLLALMFGGLLVGMASGSFRLFKESFEIRLEQIDLNEKLKNALDNAETASRAKTRFLASASHDLRQPIHTLSLYGAALNLQPLNLQSREITQHMNTALQVLATQLDALLDISKLDANIVEVKASPVNVMPLLRRLNLEMENLSKEKKLQYRFDCPQDYFVNTDEVLLERILRNIISNAIKYTDSGTIQVRVDHHDRDLVIEVVDTGCGISTDEQAHIFEEFYQVSNPERDRSKGLGLGLAIVKRLTELLEIKLAISSEPKRGSRFSLKLPLISSVTTQEAIEVGSDLVWESLSVLVIDDEEAVRLGMKTLLESIGCQVTVTDDTASSLEAVQQRIPDIVLADFRLRGKETGIQAISALRRDNPNLPAILISGDTAPDRLREANNAGLKLLHKPVMFGELKEAVVEVCHLHTGEGL